MKKLWSPEELRSAVRSIPDYPKKGIVFRDVTTLLKHPEAFRSAVAHLSEGFAADAISKVAGIEARGFIFGAALADRLGKGFIPIRKKGKLPAKTLQASYALEYGKDAIEIHADAVEPGEKILVHDDLLATGGTLKASLDLIESMGGVIVGVSVLIELTFLRGAERLKPHRTHSVIRYDSE